MLEDLLDVSWTLNHCFKTGHSLPPPLLPRSLTQVLSKMPASSFSWDTVHGVITKKLKRLYDCWNHMEYRSRLSDGEAVAERTGVYPFVSPLPSRGHDDGISFDYMSIVGRINLSQFRTD